MQLLRSLTVLTLACTVLLALSGCNSNPVANRDEIRRAKTVTVVCCDSTSPGSVVGGTSMYGGALLGMVGGGMLGAVANRGALGGSTDARTQRFLEAARQTQLNLPEDFARAVVEQLKARGLDVHLVYPMGFDGYNGRYPITDSMVKGELIVELRYAGQIVDHAERFFPTYAASFNVRRASDGKSLNSAVFATRDMSIKAPSFGDANVLRAPILVAFGPPALMRMAEFLDLSEGQIVQGDDKALIDNAARLYDATRTANLGLAKLLVSRVDEVKQ